MGDPEEGPALTGGSGAAGGSGLKATWRVFAGSFHRLRREAQSCAPDLNWAKP